SAFHPIRTPRDLHSFPTRRSSDLPIPGNDDAMRAIHLYCELASGAVLDGLQAELAASGIDVGARAEPTEEIVPEEEPLGEEAALEGVPEEALAVESEAETTTAAK